MKDSKFSKSWPSKMLITFGTLLLLVGALNANGIGVRVQVVNKDYNAGEIKPGATIKHKVRLINYSLAPIKVLARPSCGCTLTDFEQTWLPPLSSTTTNIEVETLGNRPGPYQKRVLLNLKVGQKAWEEVLSETYAVR